MDEFKLRIADQYWISKEANDPADLCSHGLINLTFNGVQVSSEQDEDWTISTSGLTLLRSINNKHLVSTQPPMILHCGQLALVGCPICIDWTITHKEQSFFITDIRKCLNTDGSFEAYNLNLEIDRSKYIREVVRYCDTIKHFFKDQPKVIAEDYYRQEWESFWHEFDSLLEKHRSELRRS